MFIHPFEHGGGPFLSTVVTNNAQPPGMLDSGLSTPGLSTLWTLGCPHLGYPHSGLSAPGMYLDSELSTLWAIHTLGCPHLVCRLWAVQLLLRLDVELEDGATPTHTHGQAISVGQVAVDAHGACAAEPAALHNQVALNSRHGTGATLGFVHMLVGAMLRTMQ